MIKISSQFYTEGEIVQMFKNAHIQQSRIKLLQELTLLKKSRIVEILKKHGCDILPTDLSKKAKREMIEEIFLEMYHDGKSDFAIACKIGVSETTIRNLRIELRLKPNRGKKIEKKPAGTGE